MLHSTQLDIFDNVSQLSCGQWIQASLQTGLRKKLHINMVFMIVIGKFILQQITRALMRQLVEDSVT